MLLLRYTLQWVSTESLLAQMEKKKGKEKKRKRKEKKMTTKKNEMKKKKCRLDIFALQTATLISLLSCSSLPVEYNITAKG